MKGSQMAGPGRLLLCVLLLIVLLQGCRKRGHPAEHYAVERLHECWNVISTAEYGSGGERPPLIMPELFDWLDEHMGLTKFNDIYEYIDVERRTILDNWGEPIILIVEDGKLVALGSKGPDRKWQGGSNDDVVYSRAEWASP